MLSFLALQEMAHARLYASVPWLMPRFEALIGKYARGISIDLDAMEEQLRDATSMDPESISGAVNLTKVGIPDTPEQREALASLESLLAMVEGWVDCVVWRAGMAHLPHIEQLREMMRRERAMGGPAERTFESLLGLQLRPKRMREATGLWEMITAAEGPEGRDAKWSHPDLLHATHLEKAIKNYSFFDYRVNEALHMTDEEHDIFVLLMRQIRDELQKRPDELQNAIIVGYIELMLNFCQRFYNRQFITRKLENSDILMKFDSLLRDYYEEKTQLTLGIPTVQYCADKLCMSPNYFGDMIKKTTGDTASNYIRQYVIQRAKSDFATGASIAQVADGLGFEYPQHLSRMFKRQEGLSPKEYCERLRKKIRVREYGGSATPE